MSISAIRTLSEGLNLVPFVASLHLSQNIIVYSIRHMYFFTGTFAPGRRDDRVSPL